MSRARKPAVSNSSPRCAALLEHLARHSRRRVEDAMEPLGLRPRHLVALSLLRDRGPASQQSLVEAFAIDPSNLVSLLNELEHADLVRRRRDPADRRRHIVEISPTGTQRLAEAEAALAQVEDEVFAGLTPDERALLFDLLLRVAGGHMPPCTEPLDEGEGVGHSGRRDAVRVRADTDRPAPT